MYPAKSVTSRFCCTDWPRCVCPSPSSICGLLLAESGDVLVVCLMKISLWSYLRAQHSSRLHCLLTVLDTGSTGHKICCCKVNWGYCKVTPSRVALPSKKGFPISTKQELGYKSCCLLMLLEQLLRMLNTSLKELLKTLEAGLAEVGFSDASRDLGVPCS
ncbi:uncharacterized protein LOC121985192 isoform X4 [Zingiber officinale]|uniref:uncharacterized protein LOC121985192 isoform X4 n=1 Tax=Zingiber officinale TaxID=94328 RepID=UPI001C4C7BA4|nr:uncharacterized protein LOC121985192 isoform X4 [Zingiber officinale]